MIKVFHPRGVKELFWKAGRTTEKVTFRRLIKKHPTQAKRALQVAQLKGIKKVQALGKRHGVEGLGAFTKGPPYVVGEGGPEYFLPKESGKILSNDDSRMFSMLLAANPQLQNVSRTRSEKILRNRFPEYFE